MPVGEGQVKVDVFVQGIIRFVETIRKKDGKKNRSEEDLAPAWSRYRADRIKDDQRSFGESNTYMANRPADVDVLLLCKVRDLFPLSHRDDWESKAR